MAFLSILFVVSVGSAYGLHIRRDNGTNSTTLLSSVATSQSLQVGEAIAAGLGVSQSLQLTTSSSSTSDSALSLSVSSAAIPSQTSASSEALFFAVSSAITPSQATASDDTHFSSTSSAFAPVQETAVQNTSSAVIPPRPPLPSSRLSPWISNSSFSPSSTSYSYPREGAPAHRTVPAQSLRPTVFFQFDNGTGSVSSCYTSIWNWWLASSSSMVSLNLMTVGEVEVTSTYASQTVPYSSLISVTPLDATPRLTTLCDGHPRIIGSAVEAAETSTGVTSYSIITTTFGTVPDYPPVPCSIAPSPCSSMWSAYAKFRATPRPLTTFLPPACPYHNEELDLQKIWETGIQPPLIQASSAQLHYWPVRLANPSDLQRKNSSGNEFCKGPEDLAWATPDLNNQEPYVPTRRNYTMPATAAPNVTQIRTAVVGDVTVTSPDVAVEFFSVNNVFYERNQDPTYASVVVTMRPDKLMTFRGFEKSDKGLYPMAYNDLNWICQDKTHPDGPWTTQDEGGKDCYQNVPAAAYFAAAERTYAMYDVFYTSNATGMASLTMLNDYRPFVVPGEAYTDVITSLYGPMASWFSFGVMDPPSALTQVVDPLTPVAATASPTAALAVTSNPASTIQAVPAQPISTTINAPPVITLDPPAKSTTKKTTTTDLPPPPTPTVISSSTGPAQAQQVNNDQQSQNVRVNNVNTTPQGQSVQAIPSSQPAQVNNQQQSQPAAVNNQQPSQNGANLQPLQVNPSTQAINIGSTTVSAVAVGTNIVVAGTTIPPGAATVIAGQQVSVPTSQGALIIGVGGAASTVAITVSPPLSISTVAPGVVAVNGQSLTTGGAVKTLNDGQQISLANTGIVVVQPATVAAVAPPQLLTIGSQTVAASSLAPNIAIVASQTLSVGGQAGSFDGHQISLAGNGIVVGTGSTAVTVPLSTAAVAAAAAAAPPQLVTIGSQIVTASNLASNVAVVGSQTLSVGGQAGSFAGQQLSLASNGIVVGTGATAVTVPIPTAAAPPPQLITVGSQTVLASSLSPNVAVVASQTLTIGGQAGSLGGQQISLASNGIVIGTGSTAITVPLASAATTGGAAQSLVLDGSKPSNTAISGSIQVGSEIFTLASTNSNVLAGAHTTFTLSAGGSAVTLNGQTLSAASSGVYIVVSSGSTSTATMARISGTTSASTAVKGSSTSTARSGVDAAASKTADGSASTPTKPASGASTTVDQNRWIRRVLTLLAVATVAIFMY